MPRIVVGFSGGVDSTLAAALLKERGFDVVAVYLKVDLAAINCQLSTCAWRDDVAMCRRVAALFDIPLIIEDVTDEYNREVVVPTAAALHVGLTPNPDSLCNRWVKFDALERVAKRVGADRIATGHYARVRNSHEYANGREYANIRIHPFDFPFSRGERREGENSFPPSPGEGGRGGVGDCELHRGIDLTKDQSYFLWMLTQEQLTLAEFPLGEWQKDDVRKEAKRRGLPNFDRRSTRGVCFLGQAGFAAVSALGADSESAEVITTDGKTIGTISSPTRLTIGQRIRIGGQSTPHYVVARDLVARRVLVSASSNDPARQQSIFLAHTINWIGTPPHFPLHCTARIRYRQQPFPCQALECSEGIRVLCDVPQTGVAPGQDVVFTQKSRVLGGGIIK
ncbi:MAG: aminomethyltransferase beta-barrel domain-containing protein [Candidatus Uhrbacteria bacterium]